MNSVLSRITRLVARLEPKQLLVLFVIPVLMLLAGMYLGRFAAYVDMNADPQTVHGMRLEISHLREELKAVTGDLQLQHTLHEVDSRALEMVRSEMATQNERTAELEEDLRFYRSLVAPDNTANGLSLRQPEIVADKRPGHFKYRFVIQQKARKHAEVEGTLSVSVVGLEGEEEASYQLVSLSPGTDEEAVALKFRYFQAIEGELVLPDGFEPKEIAVVARASKPRETEVKEQFPWELQDRFTNVGK
jgi:hypothetical protein